MAEREAYVVTEKAGPWVAGRRHEGAGTTLLLTAAQAEYELRLGTLRRAAAELPARKATAGKKPAGKTRRRGRG